VEGILSPVHLLIVGLIALLVFGPKRLPELGRSLGSGLREFRHGMSEIREQVAGENSSSAIQDAHEEPPRAEAQAPLLPVRGAVAPATTAGAPVTTAATETPSVQAVVQGRPTPAEDTGSATVGEAGP
jgi:TatA/E family protein of Tat protein translocase